MKKLLAAAVITGERHNASLEELQFILTGDRTRHDPEADEIVTLVWEAARVVQGMPERARAPYLSKLWARFVRDYQKKAKEPVKRFERFKFQKEAEALELEMAGPKWRAARVKELVDLRKYADEKIKEYEDRA
jgi:hypothetical protein